MASIPAIAEGQGVIQDVQSPASLSAARRSTQRIDCESRRSSQQIGSQKEPRSSAAGRINIKFKDVVDIEIHPKLIGTAEEFGVGVHDSVAPLVTPILGEGGYRSDPNPGGGT